MVLRHVLALAALLLASAFAPLSRAQSTSGAQSTFVDPSIANSGMGKAGVAVFWHDDPNDWENPALLGSHRGVRYLYGKTQLVPDLADDIYFTSNRLVVGCAGFGISMAGKPFDSIGGMRLEYGESPATDDQGNFVGVFRAYEEIRQLGLGINLIEAAENALRLLGKTAPRLSRRMDLSLGHAWKTVEVDLAPAYVTLDGREGRGEANERDRGALLRVTLLDQGRDAAASRGGGRLRLETAVGFSQRNYTDERISYIDEDQSDQFTEERLVGIAARATLAFPSDRHGWIWDFIAPRVSLGVAVEEARYYDDGVRSGSNTIRRFGEELVVEEFLFLRHGYINDPTGTVQDHTWGVGAQVRYRDVGGIRYDFARVPQSKFLEYVNRRGVTVFVDPYRLWEKLR